MENKVAETIKILEKLVSFQSISGTSTREINNFIVDNKEFETFDLL